jgi:hypothetical protein
MTAPLDRALVALAQEPDRRRDDLGEAIAAAPGTLADAVIAHGIAGVAHRHARHLTDRFPTLLAALDAARKDIWSRHLITVTDLREVARIFAGLGGPWAVVKGPVLAEHAYGGPDRRRYLDLDLLVDPRVYGTALDLLQGAGAPLLDRNWQLIRSSMRAELSLVINGRTSIDLHWHLLNEAGLRRRASWNMTDLLERAVIRDVGGQPVPVLEPTDALVHLAAHACLSGAHRMIWLKDIERQCTAFPVPMDALEERARAAGLWGQVNLAMLRAANTFGLPRPVHRPAWTRINQLLGCDEFRVERGFAGTGRTLASATRRTVLGSAVALGATAVQPEASADVPDRRRRWPPAAPPTLAVLRRDAGSPADRHAYLADVAASGTTPRHDG